MADKDLNMLPAIKMIKDQIRKIERKRDDTIIIANDQIKAAKEEAQKELTPLCKALEILEAANDVCPECWGKGMVRVAEIAGGSSWDTCLKCDGTGKIKR